MLCKFSKKRFLFHNMNITFNAIKQDERIAKGKLRKRKFRRTNKHQQVNTRALMTYNTGEKHSPCYFGQTCYRKISNMPSLVLTKIKSRRILQMTTLI